MSQKQKIEITIDEEDACDNFGEDTFQENIIRFVEEGYKYTYEEVKEAEFLRDPAKMKITTHTLKTTARYMSAENFALICQGIEGETKLPNWDKILELLPEFYEYYEILYQKTLIIYNRLKGKDVDDPGPLENKKENMMFFDREEKAKEKENQKIENESINKINENSIKEAEKQNSENESTQKAKNNLEEKYNNSLKSSKFNISADQKKQKIEFNFEPNFKEDMQIESSSQKKDSFNNNYNKENELIKNSDKFENQITNLNSLKATQLKNAPTFLIENQASSSISPISESIISKNSNDNQEKSIDNLISKSKNTNVKSNDIKFLEENLKPQNYSYHNNFINNNQGKNLNANSNEASNNNMKNSIRSLREFDKQGGDIYFKNTKNFGDESITNIEFKSNFYFLNY